MDPLRSKLAGRWLARLVGVLMLAAVTTRGGETPAAKQGRPSPISAEAKARILERLQAVLPEGSTLATVEDSSVPRGWHSLDGGGLRIDGKRGEAAFTVWFLPRDWIGIRRPGGEELRRVYWEGILLGQDYKTITSCRDKAVHECLQKLNMRTPSLVNGGWGSAEKIFEGRFEEADRKAQELIRRFCADGASRNEAVHSLVVLGVPAKSVFLEYAMQGGGDARRFCVSALKYFGGKDAMRVLCQVLNDPTSSNTCQQFAAMGLERLADPEAGPALLEALDHISYVEAATHTAAALARIRYAKAAPKILERMAQEKNPHYQADYAEALATLRYTEAVPAIRKLTKAEQFTASWALASARAVPSWAFEAEMALLRLTGPWGEPGDSVRLLLLPPEKAELGQPIRVALLVENVGDEPVTIIGYLGGTFTVNGTTHRVPLRHWDGFATLHVGAVWRYAYDLSPMIPKSGRCQIQYQAGKAKSNFLTLDVRAPAAREE